jgi:hypothetical protein
MLSIFCWMSSILIDKFVLIRNWSLHLHQTTLRNIIKKQVVKKHDTYNMKYTKPNTMVIQAGVNEIRPSDTGHVLWGSC